MAFDNPNSINGANPGLDPSLGVSSDFSKAEQELLGQAVRKHPTALGRVSGSLGDDDDSHSSSGYGATDDLTGLPPSAALGDGPLYGDEFESGIAPIDYTVYEIGRAYQKLSHAVESSQPHIKQAAEHAVARFSEELQNTVQSAKDDWNAPNNPARQFVEEQKSQLIQDFRQWWSDIKDDPNAQTIAERANEIFKSLSKKTGETMQTAQHYAEQWSNQLFEETYYETSNSPSDEPLILSNIGRFQPEKPFVGVIDNNFSKGGHGDQVAQMIERKGQQAPDWLGGGVGSGEWAESLVQFVDASKASGQNQAVVNLSFDLTQVNPDGSISTRYELTTEEYAALSYAQENNVLLVVATGNQGGEMSALGKASHEFDNIVAVGAIEKGQRADYSSYGDGVDFVASGQGRGDVEGTSLSAARVTGAIARTWKANPDLNYQQVIQVLEKSSTDLQAPGVDPYTGVGEPDVELSVEIAEAGYVEEGDRSREQHTLQLEHSFDDISAIPSERPAFLEDLKDAARSGWSTFKENFAEPVVELLPERAEEFVRNVGNAGEEAASRFINDPGSALETIQDAASDFHTALEGTTYPGRLFEYKPGTTPEYDPKVKQWQERMQERGWRISVDGYYGAHSAEVARQFQQEKGLTPDGIVGPDTWAAAFSTRNEVDPSGDVARGALPVGVAGTGGESSRVFSYEPGQELAYNPAVEQWQQRMQTRGWNIEVDGYYGAHSAEVARQFQEEKGLVADGIVGERTWEEAFRTDNITASPSGASVGSGLSASYGEPVSNAAPDSHYSQYSGQMTENSDLSDNMRAFLDTISYAEGTYSPDGYRIRFGGDRFDSFTDHPRIHEPFRDTTSTAAGRYQFIQGTWDGVREQIGLSDFSPESQDLAAVQLIRNRGAYEDVEAGRFEAAVTKVAKEWASFPGAGYNQPEKNLSDLKEFYAVSLHRYEEQSSFSTSIQLGTSDHIDEEEVLDPSATPIPLGISGYTDGEIEDSEGVSKQLFIQRYNSNGLSEQTIEANKETVVVIHGRAAGSESDNIQELAQQVAASNSNLQVLSVDWSSLSGGNISAEGTKELAGISENIAPVGRWVKNRLAALGINPEQLTFIGHSFGSYVSAIAAQEYGSVKNLVALDPAAGSFYGGGWTDIDHENSLDHDAYVPFGDDDIIPEFRNVASNSLAFVAADSDFTIADAGDNNRAATAHNSFIVDYGDTLSNSGIHGLLDIVDAHSGVVDVFTNALAKGHLTVPDLSLPNHQDNWYSHNGDKQNSLNKWLPEAVKGTFDLNHHEGRILADASGEIHEMVRVIDDSGTEEPDWT